MAKTPTEIRSLARVHTDAALKTLVGVMNQPEAPAAARVSAANSILDRGWGKAEQHITVERIEDMTNEQLASELAEAIAAIRELGIDPAGVLAGAGADTSGQVPKGKAQLN